MSHSITGGGPNSRLVCRGNIFLGRATTDLVSKQRCESEQDLTSEGPRLDLLASTRAPPAPSGWFFPAHVGQKASWTQRSTRTLGNAGGRHRARHVCSRKDWSRQVAHRRDVSSTVKFSSPSPSHSFTTAPRGSICHRARERVPRRIPITHV